MKKAILFLIILSSLNTWGSIDTLQLKSKITDVTVFFNGAQVSRKASIKAPMGKHLFILDELPLDLNPQSVQVNALQNCKILSVKHQIKTPSALLKDPVEKEIMSKIELQEYKIKETRNKLSVFELEEKLLLDNSLLRKKEEGSAIADIKEAADFYRARLSDIRQNRLKLTTELEAYNKTIQELYKQINEVSSKNRKAFSQVLITIECEKEISADLVTSYFIPSAGWTPTYDFRVDDITKPLNIVYNANVYQSSGENWQNVKIKLSTNNPSLSGQKPVIEPWILGRIHQSQRISKEAGSGTLMGIIRETDTNEPIPFANIIIEQDNIQIGGATTGMDGRYTIRPLRAGYYSLKTSFIGYKPLDINNIRIRPDVITFQDIELEPTALALGAFEAVNYKVPLISNDVAITVGGVSQIRGARSEAGKFSVNNKKSEIITSDIISNTLKTNTTDLVYEIDIPYSIPSDGKDYNLKIKEVSLPVNFVYHAVPKLDKDVFLTAEIPNWEILNLLTGKSSIYFQGTFTGESLLDAEQTGDTLKISLGRDRSIIVNREAKREISEKRILGNTIRETVGWEITVRNNKNTPIRIIIEDQFPISERRSIVVEKFDFAHATLDEKTGKLSWDIQLAPSERKAMNFKYTVKYPKDFNLGLD